MLFALICMDKENAQDLRMQVRPDHLVYLKSLGTKLKTAGPLIGTEGKAIGSLLIIEADSLEQITEIAASDPYSKSGLFAKLQIHHWNQVINNFGN